MGSNHEKLLFDALKLREQIRKKKEEAKEYLFFGRNWRKLLKLQGADIIDSHKEKKGIYSLFIEILW